MNQLDKNICVYLHINPIAQEIFYVGIGNKERPYLNSGRNKHWNEYVKSIQNNHIVIIIFLDLTWDEASIIERNLIKQIGRKDKGLGTLLNKSNGGEGNQSVNIWTEKELINEALKYKTKGEFYLKNRGAYKSAARRGLLEKICSHMQVIYEQNSFKLTKENCYKVALEFNRKKDLMKHKKSVYNKIIKNGWQDLCFSHMVKYKSILD